MLHETFYVHTHTNTQLQSGLTQSYLTAKCSYNRERDDGRWNERKKKEKQEKTKMKLGLALLLIVVISIVGT